jgi:SAM-dependent methyltransferase
MREGKAVSASSRGIGSVMRDGLRGRLPERYDDLFDGAFRRVVAETLTPEVRILDVGAGRQPILTKDQRPEGSYYVGLDLSRRELETAPPGSYDEMIIGDVRRHSPELDRRFDLVVSFQVLEHVKPLEAAIRNVGAYLRPGGRLVAQFSGTFSAFGLINQVVPHKLARPVMSRLLRREPETVFPAHYHHCWYTAIVPMFSTWKAANVIPRFLAAPYFSFAPPLMALYLGYEEWASRSNHPNLASYYLVDALR